jgi:predicted ribosome quality control (RQC) complex YloA/Tae2 family protein
MCTSLGSPPGGDWDAARGISPLLAREIVYRALGTLDPEDEPGGADDAALAAAVDELLHLPQTHAWAPSVGYEGEDDERAAVAYAPYELTHYPDHEAVTTISEAIARGEGVRAAGDPYRQARRRLNDLVAEGLGRQEARHASLTRSLAPAVDLDRLQWSGNAILALGWSLAPGQKELLVEPGTFEGVDEALAIEIDPALSPSENANRYFREYQRVKAARSRCRRCRPRPRELAFLRQLQTEASRRGSCPSRRV